MCHSPWLRSSSRNAFLVGLLLLTVIGCGGNPMGNIKGTVTFNGKPLKGGRVTFLSTKPNTGKTVEIGEDGSYKVEKIPVGPVKILVETDYLKKSSAYAGKNAAPADSKVQNTKTGEDTMSRYTEIPREYSNPEASDLAYTVKKGDQEHTIALTPVVNEGVPGIP